jgi:Xaa-Pro aminopeptidase/Xaa-Pro dipeptidase
MQAKKEAPDFTVLEYSPADRLDFTAQISKDLGLRSLLMESSMTVGEYFVLKEKLGDVSAEFESERYLERRMVKDETEQSLLRESIRCAEAGFQKLIPKLCIGMTEKDLADELHYLVAKEGAGAMSFATIVASGPRAAMAHGVPTEKKIEDGEMVVVDFGAMVGGYCSDMTRTLLFGNVPEDRKRVFDIVLEAQGAAIASVRPGVLAKDVEEAHREVFRRYGCEEYSLRGLGHGIGLQVHECPRVVIGNNTVLKPGMIFTVEPGIYYPEVCGARTEDVVLVTEDGVENLSATPHEIYVSNRC